MKVFYIKIGQASIIQLYKFNSEVQRRQNSGFTKYGNKEIFKADPQRTKNKTSISMLSQVQNIANSSHWLQRKQMVTYIISSWVYPLEQYS